MKAPPVILIIDDQVQNIELLEAYLFPQGYRLLTADSGPAGLLKLSENHVDLVLLDVMMPEMNGFEVTRKIRDDSRYTLLPIILVTALRETENRIMGIEAGCDDFLSKPIDKTELLARVRSLLKVKDYNDLLSVYQKKLETDVEERTAELKEALARIRSASLETIYRLSRASEYKDEDTGTHLKRMSLYTVAVARRLGMDKEPLENLLYAAPMHDLGKIGIPDRVLLKPGKLDADEWQIMKQHTTMGAEILKDSEAEYIRTGEIIARTHHEKWDGSGYPAGLKGSQIPLVSRIVAIADVFDALCSRRPYKDPFSVEQSMTIIAEGKGSQFDPQVVEAFFAITDEILEIKAKYQE